MYEVQRRPWRLHRGRTRQRHPQDDRRRQDLEEAGRRPAGTARSAARASTSTRRTPNILYAVTENLSKRPPTDDEAKRDRARGARAAGAEHRRGGLPHRGRRAHVAQDERREGRRQLESRLLVQPDPGRPERRPADHRQQRLAAQLDGRRQDLGRPHLELPQPLRQGVRRLANDVDRPAELEPDDPRQRRRRVDLVRRRKDGRQLHATSPAARSTRSTWTSSTPTTSTPACRTTIRGRVRSTASTDGSGPRTG